MAAQPMHSSGLDMFNQVKMPEGNSPDEVSPYPPLPTPFKNKSDFFFLRDDSAYPLWFCS